MFDEKINRIKMKIIAFGASNSKKSINQEFARYTATFFDNVELIDINLFPLPIYSIDLEQEHGIPETVKQFSGKIDEAELIIISLAEHNGTYTTAFKNIFDWTSRFRNKFFENKKLLLVSTSPGKRGGRGVMDAALVRFPLHGAEILGHFCLPQFQENYSQENGIINLEIYSKFEALINEIKSKF